MGLFGSGSKSGSGIYIFGIPIIEGPKAKQARKELNNDRKAIEEASDVAKNESDNERKVENTIARNEQQALSSAFRNLDGSNPAESITASIAGAVPAVADTVATIATGGLSSFFGGGFGGEEEAAAGIDTTTLVLGAAALGLVAVVATRR